ncbi:MAG: heparinase II/III family protein [Tepidisphaeraceae bacterium]
MSRLTISLLAALLLPCLAASPAQKALLDVELTIEGRAEHPTVYLSKTDLARARENRAKHDWARAAATTLLAEAESWVVKSDEELVKLIPPPAACFAYGFSGCPICGEKLKAWWGQGGVASLDDPGHIKCVNGHRLPDDAHPDSGEGWVDKDGKKFYFVGTYYSFVIDTLTTATTRLCYAYALTGEEKYAQKAALMLDHLARIYPTSETGSWDYPSDPPSGRFNRPWYQVARTLVLYVNQYDILCMSDALKQPSSSPGLTRRENIEKNLMHNGARYCYEQSVLHPALHNGQADYLRGAMAVGAAMGIPRYISWGIDGPYGLRAMIANNVDRDGQYYETTSGYSEHVRLLYLNMAEIVQRYTDAAYPNGIRLTDDPTFLSFNLLPKARLAVANLSPSLGDDTPNIERTSPATGKADAYDIRLLERLRALNTDPKIAAQIDATLLASTGGDVDAARMVDRNGDWLLFHASDMDAPATSTARPTPTTQALRHPLTGVAMDQSDLISQKGLAILRSGDAAHARAVTVRAGPTLNHGHRDELNLNLYARGYELTYDIGYILGSTHTQVGWAKQTAAHNVVLVDETTQLAAGLAGGTIEQFIAADGVSMVRANDIACYASQKLKRYARTVALIDISPEQSYVLDVFRVEGGAKHDYIFHARGTDVTFDGIAPGLPREGSLAGADINWTEKLGSDGDVQGVSNKPYWSPPPENGLGFMTKPRQAKAPAQAWSATWTVDADASSPARVRLTMLPTGTGKMVAGEMVTCEGPGNYPHLPKAQFVLSRRAGENLKSTFAAIMEPFGEKPAVKQATVLASSGDDALAVRVELEDGLTDYLLWREAGSATRKWKDGERLIAFDGTFAQLRCDADGKVVAWTSSEATRLRVGEFEQQLGPAEWSAQIERVDYEKNILQVRGDLPAEALAGQFVYVGNAGYAQESAYRVASVTREGDRSIIQLAPTRLTLGRGHLDSDPTDPTTLPNVTPLEYGKSQRRMDSGFFRGKRIGTVDGRFNTIAALAKDGMTIKLDRPGEFRGGDDLIIYDVCAGDRLRVPSWSQGSRRADGEWSVQGNIGIGSRK